MVDKALFLFSKMIDSNCRPNEFTYSVILDVLAAEGQLDRLNEIVEISNKYVTKSIYAYLVKTLSKLGHASEAHSLFCKMWRHHDGDRDAYMSMLEILCDAGKTAEALDLLNQIHEKGISADTVMYNTVFSALGKLKQISYTHTLYEQMKQNGLSPDIFTFNIIISSFGRVGLIDKATELFEEMESSDCKPDVITYNSLINCLGKNGDLDEAHMRFKEMQEKGLNPDVITYSTLIECFGKSNKVEMACRLFDEMLSVGCYPSIVTYNILLDCLEKSGKVEEAFKLYSTLKQKGLTPDAITYSVLERLESGTQRAVRARKQSRITGWVVSPLR
nr:pentatricopeptide repeat protein AaPPR165 [Agave angustifolia]UPT49292.1 pentatricopeptide repeat protein AaPPR149 [Agave angustifolia]UPT49300.1 pentatricopeptide repeat protein AaPPR164 [Agave angustifolia]